MYLNGRKKSKEMLEAVMAMQKQQWQYKSNNGNAEVVCIV